MCECVQIRRDRHRISCNTHAASLVLVRHQEQNIRLPSLPHLRLRALYMCRLCCSPYGCRKSRYSRTCKKVPAIHSRSIPAQFLPNLSWILVPQKCVYAMPEISMIWLSSQLSSPRPGGQGSPKPNRYRAVTALWKCLQRICDKKTKRHALRAFLEIAYVCNRKSHYTGSENRNSR